MLFRTNSKLLFRTNIKSISTISFSARTAKFKFYSERLNDQLFSSLSAKNTFIQDDWRHISRQRNFINRNMMIAQFVKEEMHSAIKS